MSSDKIGALRPRKRLVLWLSYAAILAINLTCLGVADLKGAEVLRYNREFSERQAAAADIIELLSITKDAETGQRGYLITGDDTYLQPYQEALARVGSQLISFKSKAGTAGIDRSEVKLIETLVEGRLGSLRATMVVRRTKGFDAAKEVVKSSHGKEIMDQLRAECARLLERENAALAEGRSRLDQLSHGRTQIFAFATVFNILLFSLGFFRLLRRGEADD